MTQQWWAQLSGLKIAWVTQWRKLRFLVTDAPIDNSWERKTKFKSFRPVGFIFAGVTLCVCFFVKNPIMQISMNEFSLSIVSQNDVIRNVFSLQTTFDLVKTHWSRCIWLGASQEAECSSVKAWETFFKWTALPVWKQGVDLWIVCTCFFRVLFYFFALGWTAKASPPSFLTTGEERWTLRKSLGCRQLVPLWSMVNWRSQWIHYQETWAASRRNLFSWKLIVYGEEGCREVGLFVKLSSI